MNDITKATKALSEEIRIRILLLLQGQEACVCDLMEVFKMAQSKLSHHLIILRDAGFLLDEKRGKWNYYSLNVKALTPLNRSLLNSIDQNLYGNSEVVESDRKALNRAKNITIC